jgi:excisionase family DNA binding protein
MSASHALALSAADDMMLLTTREAAQYVRLSRSTLERKRLDGSGPPFVKLGLGKRARVVYRRTELDHWLRTLSFASTSQYCPTRRGK